MLFFSPIIVQEVASGDAKGAVLQDEHLWIDLGTVPTLEGYVESQKFLFSQIDGVLQRWILLLQFFQFLLSHQLPCIIRKQDRTIGVGLMLRIALKRLCKIFGNAFVPWLCNHYSKIYVVDPRHVNGNNNNKLILKDFLADKPNCDIILCSFIYNANNITGSYYRGLLRMLK